MSRPFYSDAKKAKKCRSSPPPSHFLFPRNFSGTITGTNIIKTPPEPSWPTDVPFVGYKTESKDVGGVLAAKSYRHTGDFQNF